MSNASSDKAGNADSGLPSTPTRVTSGQTARRQPWGPFAAIVITLLDYVLSNVAAVLVVSIVFVGGILKMFGVSGDTFSQLLGGTLSQCTYVLVAEASALGFLWWFMRRRRISLSDIGLGRWPRWSDLGWALFMFLCYFGSFIIVSLIATHLGINAGQKQDLGVATYGQSPLGLILLFISLIILPPVTEEIMFRGFLFRGLRRAWPIGVSVVSTSLLFGSLHLFGGFSGEGLLWIAGIDTFVLSLYLCYLRLQTNSLWASIGVHMLKNSMAFVALFIFHQG